MVRFLLMTSMLAAWLLALPSATAAAQPAAVAYVQGGNLWVTTLPDGQARQVTTGGNVQGPRWSEGGDWLAYHQGNQVMVTPRSGGSPHALHGSAAVSSFAWSPVAQTIAYLSNNTTYVASAPDWQERALPDTSFGTWSPDGKQLAFVRMMLLGKNGPGNVPERATSLWRVTIDGGQPVQVYNAGSPSSAGLILAGWSADGNSILVWPDPQYSASLLADGAPLEAVPAAGGTPRQVSDAMLTYPDFLAVAPAGPDVAIAQGAGRETWTGKRIAVVNLAAGSDRPLTPTSLAAVQPAWSPDGQRLAYVAAPDAGATAGGDPATASLAKRRIWVMNRDGSGQTQLTNDPAYRDERPQWSADGSQLLFARLDQAGKASLWLMNADGSGLTKVVDNVDLPGAAGAFGGLGDHGHLNWDAAFAWQPGAAVQLPAAGAGGAVRAPLADSALLALALLGLSAGSLLATRAARRRSHSFVAVRQYSDGETRLR